MEEKGEKGGERAGPVEEMVVEEGLWCPAHKAEQAKSPLI